MTLWIVFLLAKYVKDGRERAAFIHRRHLYKKEKKKSE